MAFPGGSMGLRREDPAWSGLVLEEEVHSRRPTVYPSDPLSEIRQLSSSKLAEAGQTVRRESSTGGGSKYPRPGGVATRRGESGHGASGLVGNAPVGALSLRPARRAPLALPWSLPAGEPWAPKSPPRCHPQTVRHPTAPASPPDPAIAFHAPRRQRRRWSHTQTLALRTDPDAPWGPPLTAAAPANWHAEGPRSSPSPPAAGA